jgi:hypothetical protein
VIRVVPGFPAKQRHGGNYITEKTLSERNSGKIGVPGTYSAFVAALQYRRNAGAPEAVHRRFLNRGSLRGVMLAAILATGDSDGDAKLDFGLHLRIRLDGDASLGTACGAALPSQSMFFRQPVRKLARAG